MRQYADRVAAAYLGDQNNPCAYGFVPESKAPTFTSLTDSHELPLNLSLMLDFGEGSL